jgi:hypothetical protein
MERVIIKKNKQMKKVYLLFTVIVAFLMTGCEKDTTFGDGDPALEHLYYVGFYKTGGFNDALNYTVANGASAAVPVEFHSERVRSYDVVTVLWITNDAESNLVAGTDYSVSLETGAALTPNSGVYSLTWKQAKKAQQNVVIKRLSAAVGKLKVNTLDPAKGAPNVNDLTTFGNSKTSEYEVRGLSHDFNKVTVNFN